MSVLDTILPYLVAGNAAVAFLQAGYMLLSSKGTAALAAAEKLTSRVDTMEAEEKLTSSALSARFQLIDTELAVLKNQLSHLPDKQITHRLELAVEKLAGQMSTLDERLKPMGHVTDRLQEFLLEQARQK